MEPLMPDHGGGDDEIVAAEPGRGAPAAGPAEEPDVLTDGAGSRAPQDTPASDDPADSPATRDAPFRTPRPGDSLSPDELDAETPD